MRTFTLSVVLLASAAWARADDDVDPEPQGGTAILRKLKGTWTASRTLTPKGEGRTVPYVYTFDGEKASYMYNGRVSFTATLAPDKSRPDAFAMKRDNVVITTKYFFKVEKGELFLTANNSNDPKAKPDFTGQTTSVTIFSGENK